MMLACASQAQLTTGIVEGTVSDAGGRPRTNIEIIATCAAGFLVSARTDALGRFTLTLPYGRCRVGEAEIFVAPLQITRVTLTNAAANSALPVTWPDPFSVQGILLNRDTTMVSAPLNFTGLYDNRLSLISARAMSWTATEFHLNGMNTTDPYQPGHPLMVTDPDAISEMNVRAGFSQLTSAAFANEAGIFTGEAGPSWHGDFSTANSGSIFSWSNLPPPAMRGIVQQTEFFRWFTHDDVQISGPVLRRADFFAAVAGQWSSQTAPLAAGEDQDTQALYANVRGRIRLGRTDRVEAAYSGSRLRLSNFATPAGFEALEGWANMPSFVLPGGFAGQSEADRFDAVQIGWTHAADALTELRYQYATAHLGTSSPNSQSTVELLDGAVTGAPPLNNLAARTRQAIEGVWQPRSLFGSTRHRFAGGAGWQSADARNRFTAPSDILITADGAPAFVLKLNTPTDALETVRWFTAYAADHFQVARDVSLDGAVLADFSRASPISWNSLSPRVAFSWQPPHMHGLVLRGTYFRVYTPLAARDLDFASANSLGGSLYQVQTGALLMRFGGAYSSIAPSLKRPYADEFDVAAEFPLTRAVSISAHLYRRDDKNRLALVDTGVPFMAYAPVPVFDSVGQQTIIVYTQNPATFGQDRYVLTNPPDLRFETSGVLAALRIAWRGLLFATSFTAQNGWGPTNPGDSPIENDPGVIGALGLNPNTLINASGRNYFDRGFIGKIQAAYRLPWRVELSSTAVYLDGLPFARQLLVTGLPQGPIVVATTIRGNPGDGNRAEYVFNWNLRVQRAFRSRAGTFTGAIDVMNVTNAGHRIQESDISGPDFSQRLPVAIQEPRWLRLLFRYDF